MQSLTTDGDTGQAVEVEFRTIERFPGYRFGSDGSVWSCKSGLWKPMKPRKNFGDQNQSRYTATLARRSRFVHRLICEAFHGPCPEGMECCHNDGNGFNNAATNLRWDTRKNNFLDRLTHDTMNWGERHGISKLTDAQVLEIRDRRRAGEPLAAIAADFGISQSTASGISTGKFWKHLPGAVPKTVRTRKPRPVKSYRFAPGEKLCPEVVPEIQRLRGDGMKLAAIAAIYGVSESAISRVCSSKTWQMENVT